MDERGFVHSTTRTHRYAAKCMRCYGVYDWYLSKRTNIIVALVDKTLLIPYQFLTG
ncbi:hypothetical protein OTSGILL_1612 [Orientia tsutsugamushi str. Gilliam]|uniref:Uncharacterized protein n=1 Tax=Orientia tsutsugamushi str. Gilliam TaxID=1359184 RepID=A0A0F3M9J7_ORITS|nr:hypothetical protein OTSGILL_1612 [Orientia tsutsugamushi str. Gilliam]SPR05616.1 Uncharacterised protein [Orientia tsutsugamushi str. Gilliam]